MGCGAWHLSVLVKDISCYVMLCSLMFNMFAVCGAVHQVYRQPACPPCESLINTQKTDDIGARLSRSHS